MPMLPPHKCASCGRLVVGRCGPCDRRPDARVRGRRLQQLRYELSRQQPFCAACGVHVAAIRDHVIPLWAGGRDVASNVQNLCVDCHKTKTAAEAKDRYAY